MTDYISQLPPGLDRAILRIMSFRQGVDNAISRISLRTDCKNSGFHVDDRTLRAAINHLRKQGEPICSTGGEGGGYYLATTRQELDDYIEREIQSKIKDYSEQIRAMRSHYPQDNQLSLI